MHNPALISGFTIVRNAQVLGFPFKESVLSALPLCDEFVINCGDSDDDTKLICEELQSQFPDKIKIIHTAWERENQSGGFQLKAQTDRAMNECKGHWLIYIQADEVFHEADYPLIQKALKTAEGLEEVDGLVFDYLHFYGNYSYLMRGRNWYRREVRIFKNGRGIESYRDAQGFRRSGKRLKAIQSRAKVFHYGYVRTLDGMRTKVEHMSQWWGERPNQEEKNLKVYKPVGLCRFEGSHPSTMKQKINDNNTLQDPSRCKRKWDLREFKNALTLIWEKCVPYRIGEYRNYDLVNLSNE